MRIPSTKPLIAAIALLVCASCQMFKTPTTPPKAVVTPDHARELGITGGIEIEVLHYLSQNGYSIGSSGIVGYEGLATNRTNMALSLCSVTLKLTDEKGVVVGQAMAATNAGLAIGQQWRFQAIAMGSQSFAKVEIGQVLAVPAH